MDEEAWSIIGKERRGKDERLLWLVVWEEASADISNAIVIKHRELNHSRKEGGATILWTVLRV